MISIEQLMVNVRDVGGVLRDSAAHAQGVTLKDMGAAAVAATKAIVSDRPLVEEAVRAQRWAVCLACPLLTASQQCDKEQGGCNCYMPGKVRLSSATCPKGRW